MATAFSERTGGVSAAPFGTLDLAGHVGDDPAAVDENRDRFLEALGLGRLRGSLTCAEQVHGDRVVAVGPEQVGAGAFVTRGAPPVAQCDALITALPDVPLMLLYADCVPVVIVGPGPAVGVVHAGWRGALAGIAASTVRAMAERYGIEPSDMSACIGPHIGGCHYETDEGILSQFVNTFGTVARAESGGLDLGAVVTATLTDAGVDSCSITSLGTCTAETTDRFYSYRAEGGRTGRHCALVCIVS